MNGKDAIQTALYATKYLFTEYLKDLSDEDLRVRPVPGANHAAWQIGHLIQSEIGLVKSQLPNATYPDLPAGFTERHANDAAATENTQGLATKAEYLHLFTQVRDATIATVGTFSDEDLDQAAVGPMAAFAPTLGAMLVLVSNHTLMHGGQFSVIRRKLGKPVLF